MAWDLSPEPAPGEATAVSSEWLEWALCAGSSGRGRGGIAGRGRSRAGHAESDPGGHQVPVGAQAHGADGRLSSSERQPLATQGNVPYLDVPVLPARDQCLAAVEHSQAPDGVGMSAQGSPLLSWRQHRDTNQAGLSAVTSHLTIPRSPPVYSVLPSAVKRQAETPSPGAASGKVSVAASRPSATSQNETVGSPSAAEASVLPSGANTTAVTGFLAPRSVARCVRVATSQSRTVRSLPPEASVLPSGEKATASTGAACPTKLVPSR